MLVIANVSVFSHEGSDPGTSDFCYLVIFKSQEKHSCCSCDCKNCKMLSKNEWRASEFLEQLRMAQYTWNSGKLEKWIENI